MIPFPGWRNVGLALRDARRREGVIHSRAFKRVAWGQDGEAIYVDHAWRSSNGREVLIGLTDRLTSIDLTACDGRNEWNTTYNDDPAEVLRVLAALGLIPADIAYAADERYGRCEVCGRLAQWSPPVGDLWPGRWFHVRRIRFDNSPHLAEVADA